MEQGIAPAQEMAVLPRARCVRTGADTRGSAVLCGDGEELGNVADDLYVMSKR